MEWFSAAAVFEISVPDEVLDYSISLLLVQADDEEHAKREAMRHAKAAEDTYANSDGDRVSWRCREVLFAQQLLDGAPAEGNEVFYCFVDAETLDDVRSHYAK